MVELLHTDCMEYMATLPDKAFELAIVDPPYGIGVMDSNPIANKSGDKNHNYATGKSQEWDSSAPSQAYFDELKRVSKEQIIWGGNYFLDHLGYCKAPIIWDKLNGMSMYADGEMAWTSKGLPRNLRIFKHQWCGAFKDSERNAIKIHPTQKPVQLYKWLLKNYAKEGDRILDTHLGSGSSAIAAFDGGFDFVGCEIDADYYAAAVKRFNIHKMQQVLF